MATKFESIIPLRPSDFDINGHVHHSKYFDLLLAAREDQMDRCYGMPMSAFVERGWGWMVRRYEIEYKRALKQGDQAQVRTWSIGVGDSGKDKRIASLVTIGFEICIASSGKIAAHGNAVYVMVDIKTSRPAAIPQDVIEIYSI